MNRILYSNVSVAGFTMTLPLIAVFYAASMPGSMSTLALVATTILAVGTTSVLFNAWRNAQPTQTITHVLQPAGGAAEAPGFAAPARDRRQTPRSDCP